MARIKKVTPKQRPESWVSTAEVQINGRNVARGDQITVRDHDGRKRRVKFLEYVDNGLSSWVTCSEPMEKGSKTTRTRSWTPDKVITIHRKQKETR